jgi:hypothetical protein
MNKLDFDKRMETIESGFEYQKKELYNEYAIANNPHDVGDIIRDSSSKIRISKIVPTMALSAYPECKYFGEKLRQSDNKPFKNKDYDWIYQSNIVD